MISAHFRSRARSEFVEFSAVCRAGTPALAFGVKRSGCGIISSSVAARTLGSIRRCGRLPGGGGDGGGGGGRGGGSSGREVEVLAGRVLANEFFDSEGKMRKINA